ncbi:hypothetical protein JKP88DRAFT_269940 [Tribonema minus]|uniref:Sphingomyelin synthase-like domain-containing protein n=1 Tax=Tribonema minus TaxID=303371 RepID=A0A835YVL2_9STRA|nr:hypothetical protein JKP88DRAFT_269940 [Tribonema minus]
MSKRARSVSAPDFTACGCSAELSRRSPTTPLKQRKAASAPSVDVHASAKARGEAYAGCGVEADIRPSSRSPFSHLVMAGVQLESWLVGLQHQMLLGVPHGGGRKRSLVAPKFSVQHEVRHEQQRCCNDTCKCPQRQGTMLGWLLQQVDDFLERACFSRGFLSHQYLSRLLFSVAFFLVCAYLNAIATMVSSHRNPYIRLLDLHGNLLPTHTMPDLGHDLWAVVLTRLGHHTDFIDEHSLPDRLVSALGRVTFFLIIAHPRRRVSMIFGALLLMRAVSVSVTVLPDASPVCHAQFTSAAGAYKHQPLFPAVFARAARFVLDPTSTITCGDMMFSGHTTCLMMFALVFRQYLRAKHLQTKVLFRGAVSERFLAPIRHAVYAYVACGCLVIIGSKLHYSIDVLYAIGLSFFTFRTYHEWARTAQSRRRNRLLQWLEDDTVRGLDDAAYARARRD